MAQVVNAGANQIKLNNGQLVTGQLGGWYDGQQYGGGALSSAGQFNPAVSGKSGQAPVQSSADAGFLAKQGDTAAPSAVVNNGGGNPTGGNPAPSPSGMGLTAPTQPSIDLNSLYDSIYNSPEIKAAQADVTAKQQAIIDKQAELQKAEASIGDNPFAAESVISGKIARLRADSQPILDQMTSEAQTSQNALDQLKADASTKLNMNLKQYDINRQDYQDNLSKFDTLLKAGALNNASSQDVASLSQLTGFSPSMIQNIVDQSAKDSVKPQVVTSTDDNGNVTVAVIDANTGNIINKQSLGQVSTTKSSGSGAAGSKQQTQAATSDMSQLINGGVDATGDKNNQLVKGSDGKLSPQAYDYYRNLWVSQGLSAKDFETQFGYLKNPNNPNY